MPLKRHYVLWLWGEKIFETLFDFRNLKLNALFPRQDVVFCDCQLDQRWYLGLLKNGYEDPQLLVPHVKTASERLNKEFSIKDKLSAFIIYCLPFLVVFIKVAWHLVCFVLLLLQAWALEYCIIDNWCQKSDAATYLVDFFYIHNISVSGPNEFDHSH